MQRSLVIKFSILTLCFLTLQIFVVSDQTVPDVIDLFGGPESFVERDIFIFARCQKFHEKFEKICIVKRFSNIFDTAWSIVCPAILESRRRHTIVGSRLKIVPFGIDQAIVVWVEEYHEADAAPQEVFIKFTNIHFDNCKRRDVEISLPLEKGENPDDSLDRVRVVTNDDDETFLVIFYNENLCGNKLCKMSFDDRGNKVEEVKPWFSLQNGIIKDFVPLKRGFIGLGFLAFSDLQEIYLVNEKGSKVLKLDIYADAESQIIYSNNNNEINLCYYADAAFSCGRFTNDGQLIMRRRFILEWELVNMPSLYYLPKFGLVLVTYSNSISCDDTEIQEHSTLVNNEGLVESLDLGCRSNNFTSAHWFRNDRNEICSFEYMLRMKIEEEHLLIMHRFIPNPAPIPKCSIKAAGLSEKRTV